MRIVGAGAGRRREQASAPGLKASVVVSKFATSIDIGHLANFETKTTLGINSLLVSFDSEIRQEPDMEMKRISESGHLPQVGAGERLAVTRARTDWRSTFPM